MHLLVKLPFPISGTNDFLAANQQFLVASFASNGHE